MSELLQQLERPKAEQQNPVQLIASAIEESLNEEDLNLLIKNINETHDFIRTKEGGEALQSFVNAFKKSIATPSKGDDLNAGQ